MSVLSSRLTLQKSTRVYLVAAPYLDIAHTRHRRTKNEKKCTPITELRQKISAGTNHVTPTAGDYQDHCACMSCFKINAHIEDICIVKSRKFYTKIIARILKK